MSLDLPFSTDSEQDHVLHAIRRDLADGKPRMKMWLRKMKPSLRGLREEGALLEGILLAASSKDEALQVLEGIEAGQSGEVAKKHARLIRIRSGEMTDWRACALIEDDDGLSSAMRVAAWRRVEHYGEDLVADELLRGVSILGEIGEQLSVTVRWELAGKLVSENRMNEAVTIVEGAEIEYSEHVSICLLYTSPSPRD